MAACLKPVFPLLLTLGSLLTACNSQSEKTAATTQAPTAKTAAPLMAAVPVPSSVPLDSPLSAADKAYNDTLSQLSPLLQRTFPRGQVKDFKSGDLNADGRRDIVVVMEMPCDSAMHERSRTVLLLLRDSTAQLQVAARNCWYLVYPRECAGHGEQYSHTDVGGGRVTFHSYQIGVDYAVTFRYERASRDWWLYRRVRIKQASNNEPYHDPIVTRQTPRTFGRVRFADYTGGEF